MDKKLVINVAGHETRVALLEHGVIAELFIKRQDDADITGNIYKGRVQRVLPGMQAAFVNIGLKQAAFIHVNDIFNHHEEEFRALFEQRCEADDEDIEDSSLKLPVLKSKPVQIEDLISENQELMVQVAKSPIGSKGARVTSHISLPGRFLVIMPDSDHIGVSRRIIDERERLRLREAMASLRNDHTGYIVRTAAEGINTNRLAEEMEFLNNLWKNIQKKSPTASAPSLLHQELNISLRAVRDLLIHEADKIIIDSRQGYESIITFVESYMPGLKDSIERYHGPEPIFDAFDLEGDISRALNKKVWLKSGGDIVIEHTEALVAVDVNTGRYTGTHNLEETALKTNLEAVKEIVYQIRLRDIGGIIIIDFIDMEKQSNQEKVFNALREALKRDRSKTHVLPISEIGLVQMTRKRVRRPLTNILCEPCFNCEGEGYRISRQTICYQIYRAIIREAQDMTGSKLTLNVNPEIAELLHGEENNIINSLEYIITKQIVIYPNGNYHLEEFEIFEVLNG
ncbi:MAG: Rne/Rng family ribonuclease [Desulfobacterales bacterium]